MLVYYSVITIVLKSQMYYVEVYFVEEATMRVTNNGFSGSLYHSCLVCHSQDISIISKIIDRCKAGSMPLPREV